MTDRYVEFRGHDYAHHRAGRCSCGTRRAQHTTAAQQVALERDNPVPDDVRCPWTAPDGRRCTNPLHRTGEHVVLPYTAGETDSNNEGGRSEVGSSGQRKLGAEAAAGADLTGPLSPRPRNGVAPVREGTGKAGGGHPTLIGYARVSTLEQDPQLQLDALAAAGVDRVWADRASGARTDRPQLAAALDYAREGDVLVVWRLDRLGRSLRHLLELAGDLERRGVGLRSLTEQIDTTTAGGRLVFALFGALAEFERELIRERTQAGLSVARARGRTGGRPKVVTPAKASAARALLADGATLAEAAAAVGVGRSTLHRALSTRTAGVDSPTGRV